MRAPMPNAPPLGDPLCKSVRFQVSPSSAALLAQGHKSTCVCAAPLPSLSVTAATKIGLAKWASIPPPPPSTHPSLERLSGVATQPWDAETVSNISLGHPVHANTERFHIFSDFSQLLA